MAGQRSGAFIVGWLKGLAERWDVHAQLTEKDISPFFWPNGTMPASDEFDRGAYSTKTKRPMQFELFSIEPC